MSQRERLLGRRLPPTTVRIRVDFSTESDSIRAELESAQRALAEAVTAEEVASARQRVDTCQARWDACHEVLTVNPLAPHAYDELISAHPPTDEQRDHGFEWNPDTFVPALLAACIGQDADDPMTEQDWAEWISTPQAAASGEVALLVHTCIQVNDRSPDIQVGKGFGGTPV